MNPGETMEADIQSLLLMQGRMGTVGFGAGGGLGIVFLWGRCFVRVCLVVLAFGLRHTTQIHRDVEQKLR